MAGVPASGPDSASRQAEGPTGSNPAAEAGDVVPFGVTVVGVAGASGGLVSENRYPARYPEPAWSVDATAKCLRTLVPTPGFEPGTY